MAEEPITLSTLAQFHREVILPDIERVVGDAVEASERRLRDEMHSLFDSLGQKLERLETGYHMLVAAVKRIEERLDRIEQRMALRSEVEELKAKIAALQGRVAELESRL